VHPPKIPATGRRTPPIPTAKALGLVIPGSAVGHRRRRDPVAVSDRSASSSFESLSKALHHDAESKRRSGTESVSKPATLGGILAKVPHDQSTRKHESICNVTALDPRGYTRRVTCGSPAVTGDMVTRVPRVRVVSALCTALAFNAPGARGVLLLGSG
jgi:hypothetical protein